MSGSIHEAEDLVRRLPDVAGCRIDADPDGDVFQVQVTTHGARPIEDVRADVVTVLATQAGIDVLEEQVQVEAVVPVPAAERELELEPLEVAARPRLVAVRSEATEERTVVEAELALGAETASGRAEARGSGSAPDLLAQACLDALEKLCGARVVFRLLGSRRSAVGDHDTVTVVVQESQGRESRTHVGAAAIDDDLARALAYAALAALNRRYGHILALPPRTYRIE